MPFPALTAAVSGDPAAILAGEAKDMLLGQVRLRQPPIDQGLVPFLRTSRKKRDLESFDKGDDIHTTLLLERHQARARNEAQMA